MQRSFKRFGSSPFILLPAALMIFCSSTCAAQSQPAPAQTPELAGIAHAAIRVADLGKSRDFYEKLGFQEAFSMAPNGTVTQSFIKVNDLQFIELYPQRNPSDTAGFMHICFESADIQNLNQIYASRGLSPIAVRRAGAGNLLFTMQGPEKQNIEYTQYMPGSKHTNDRGLHLGAKRISQQIVGMGIEMQDTGAAAAFYREKLGFKPTGSLLPGQIALALPGSSGQQIELVQHVQGSAFQFFFAVTSLRSTAAQLKSLQIPFQKQRSTLWIQDPDGNRIFFVKLRQR
ncbi:MAG: VOC family protein [Terracidiphilus sp.]